MTKFATLSSAVALAFAFSPMAAQARPLAFSLAHAQTANGNHAAPVKAPKKDTYLYDDGSSENAVAFGNGSSNLPSLWFVQFTTVKGGEAIKEVDIAWGTPSNSSPANQMDGQPVTIAIWSDPNNDGNPSDAKLLAEVKGTINKSNKDKFVAYKFSKPVMIGPAGTNFFVGDATPAESNAELFFQGLDTDVSSGKSWVAAQSGGGKLNIKNPGKNDTVGTIDSFGLPGNWMIRAVGTK